MSFCGVVGASVELPLLYILAFVGGRLGCEVYSVVS